MTPSSREATPEGIDVIVADEVGKAFSLSIPIPVITAEAGP